MYLIFVGLVIPLIGLATFAYRVSLCYFAARDACYKASVSSSFGTITSVPPGAVANAASAWNTDVAAWHYISGSETIVIVRHPVSGAAETIYTTHLPAPPAPPPNLQTDMYFIRLTAACTIDPLIPVGKWQGMVMPGLTSPFPLTLKYQTYLENPFGMTQ